MYKRTMLASAMVTCTAMMASTLPGFAQSADDLAKSLANPIASTISVPIQQDFEFGGGPGSNGFVSLTDIEPVIPIKLSDDWNLISRTIIPLVHQERIQPNHEAGLGDVVRKPLFLALLKPGPGGLIWGVGPVFLFPTATNARLGSEKWGAGPTAVALIQRGKWTLGGLANHIWSFAGDSRRQEVNQTYLQPFVAYSLGGGRSIGGSVEATYDWVNKTWNVPLNVSFNQVFKIGSQPMQFSIGPKLYLARPNGGSRWGVRAKLVFLFPK